LEVQFPTFVQSLKITKSEIQAQQVADKKFKVQGSTIKLYLTYRCRTFLPHMAKQILPPSSCPAGMLLMALIRSPAHAHITRGLTDMGVPSLSTLPRSSFAIKEPGVTKSCISKLMQQKPRMT
jgi:hypothetical protein